MPKPFPWPIDDMMQWYDSGMSLQEVADKLSSGDWLSYWIDRLGRPYRPGQKIVNKVLKRSGVSLRGRGAPMERNGFWNGGRIVDKDGYVLLKSIDHPLATAAGYVREHRLVMEKKIGRYLTRDEVVHHIDGDRQNNRIENLELFSDNSTHVSVTQTGHVSSGRSAIAIESSARKRNETQARVSPVAVKWYNDGLNVKQIASILGCSPHTASKYLRMSGVTPRRGRPIVPITERHRREARTLPSIR